MLSLKWRAVFLAAVSGGIAIAGFVQGVWPGVLTLGSLVVGYGLGALAVGDPREQEKGGERNGVNGSADNTDV